MFDWFKLALAFVDLANKIVDWRRESNSLTVQHERLYAAALLESARRTKVVKDIEEQFKLATPEEVLTALKGDFRD